MFYFRRILILFSCTLLFNRSHAQIFSGNPPSIKWKQINTSSSRVIFPKGLDSVAQRITSIISYIKIPTQKTIGNQSKKINIVLQRRYPTKNCMEKPVITWRDLLISFYFYFILFYFILSLCDTVNTSKHFKWLSN